VFSTRNAMMLYSSAPPNLSHLDQSSCNMFCCSLVLHKIKMKNCKIQVSININISVYRTSHFFEKRAAKRALLPLY
jgi:hypothetical protein